MTDPDGIRTIAYYLPQFAPAPENERWWGRGFTEWTNVVSAAPRWPGHHQPRLPAAFGSYDLRSGHTLEEQVELARAFGISAFCIYHYWSLGHRVLGTFLDRYLATQRPDFPFCLSWGNHRWSRTWDAASKSVLLEQRYSAEDDLRHAAFLHDVFADPRYVRVLDRPFLAVHCPHELPEPRRFVTALQAEAARRGVPPPYLVAVESQPAAVGKAQDWGFDAALDFQPNDFDNLPAVVDPQLAPVPTGAVSFRPDYVFDYTRMEGLSAGRLQARQEQPWLIPCVMPDWDNSARRPADPAVVFLGSTPDRYRRWVEASRVVLRGRPEPERLLFVNAWNEWGEGAALEPDTRWGTGYLEAHLP